jgi:hypothetical protein
MLLHPRRYNDEVLVYLRKNIASVAGVMMFQRMPRKNTECLCPVGKIGDVSPESHNPRWRNEWGTSKCPDAAINI